MKPTGQRWTLDTPHKINAFVEFAAGRIDQGAPITVQIMKADRTTSQNSMFYGLYRGMAEAHGDISELEARRHCKLHYGIPILRSHDPEFCTWYDENMKGRPYEAKLVAMDYIAVTSEFDKEQGTTYIETILKEQAALGYYIPKP